MLIYNATQLELLNQLELEAHDGIRLNDVNFRHRSPLVGQFRLRRTGLEFMAVTAHLARRDDELRTEQARGLSAWAAAQTVPVVAIGDFNFDYDFASQAGNAAFDAMMAAEVWTWVKPNELIDTQWSDDGISGDRYPDSMLDFAFVAGWPDGCEIESLVIVRDGDFPEDDATSDHRPIELTVRMAGADDVK